MGKIKLLSEDLIKKIAAGQVIERPSSVVKELIENSIDAEAHNIKIELEDGGKNLIKVTDDGIGMDFADLALCFKAHATSKIYSEEDLLSVLTMGFRGEALYSIASVSNLTIKSRTKNNITGSFYELENEKVLNHGSLGMPQGTSVAVRNLFQSMPARRKFLKTNKTELRYVLDTTIPYCIAYPHIGFFLSHNKHIIFDLPPFQSVTERVFDLLGEQIAKYLIPVSFEDFHFKISGFVTRPQVATPNRYKQYLFVNRRHVISPLISDAVKGSYGTLLPPRLYPTFVLFIDLPPSLVDVNIHPRKEKVAFTDDSYIYDLFYKSVSEVFLKEELTYERDSSLEPMLMEEYFKDYDAGKNLPILQVHNLYLIRQFKNGLILVDQHAAHERILYEKLLESYKNGHFNDVIYPNEVITINLSLSDAQVLEEHINKLKSFGIELENFGKSTYKVLSYPKILRGESLKDFVEEIIVVLKEGRSFNTVNTHVKHVLSTMACKSAIKSGDLLTEIERENLLNDLEKTTTRYTCPHGRPVKMEITLNELARMFKRK